MSSLLEIRDLKVNYGGIEALKGVSFDVKEGEIVTLIGANGAGKSTTLRAIMSVVNPASGTISYEGKDITDVPPYKRRVNTVFQKYALFPHLNVRDNIAFGLKIKKMSRGEIDRRVDKMLSLVNLAGYGKRSVDSLSGGQQQRIAIARALVNEPDVLLLDEPLGALDLKLRKEMQLELKSMQQQLGITFIYVTHDQEEALTMSDTIVVMNSGRILQIGPPKTIYDEPKNAFVARFIGESNIIRGTMVHDELVSFSGVDFPCVDSGFGENVPVDVVIRPEDIVIVGEDIGQLTGTVTSVLFKGVHYEMMIDAGDFTWKVHSTTMQPAGSRVGLAIVPFNIHIMRPMKEDVAP